MGESDPLDGADPVRQALTDLTDQVRRLALDVQAMREEVQVGYESGDSTNVQVPR
jgi:outer membrane murein-binding lipoprotein Lpp